MSGKVLQEHTIPHTQHTASMMAACSIAWSCLGDVAGQRQVAQIFSQNLHFKMAKGRSNRQWSPPFFRLQAFNLCWLLTHFAYILSISPTPAATPFTGIIGHSLNSTFILPEMIRCALDVLPRNACTVMSGPEFTSECSNAVHKLCSHGGLNVSVVELSQGM